MRTLAPEVTRLLAVEFDVHMREAWARALQLRAVDLRADVLLQASLPVRHGGLGLFDSERLRVADFCGSLARHGAEIAALFSTIGLEHLLVADDDRACPRLRTFRHHHRALLALTREDGAVVTMPAALDAPSLDLSSCSHHHARRAFAGIIHDRARRGIGDAITATTDWLPFVRRQHRAALRSAAGFGAGAWLHHPIGARLFEMDADRFILAIRLRLRLPLFRPGLCCPCGEPCDTFGFHAMSCMACGGPARFERHQLVRDEVSWALAQAGRRPRVDGLDAMLSTSAGSSQLDLRADGRDPASHVGVDVTVCTPTHATGIRLDSDTRSLAVARFDEGQKRRKYRRHILPGWSLLPVALEVYGAWGPAFETYLRTELLHDMAAHGSHDYDPHWDDPIAGADRSLVAQYAQQRVAVALQSGNAGLIIERRAMYGHAGD